MLLDCDAPTASCFFGKYCRHRSFVVSLDEWRLAARSSHCPLSLPLIWWNKNKSRLRGISPIIVLSSSFTIYHTTRSVIYLVGWDHHRSEFYVPGNAHSTRIILLTGYKTTFITLLHHPCSLPWMKQNGRRRGLLSQPKTTWASSRSTNLRPLFPSLSLLFFW